jgi:hypothetical protein
MILYVTGRNLLSQEGTYIKGKKLPSCDTKRPHVTVRNLISQEETFLHEEAAKD